MLTTFLLHYSPDKYSEFMDAMVEVLKTEIKTTAVLKLYYFYCECDNDMIIYDTIMRKIFVTIYL